MVTVASFWPFDAVPVATPADALDHAPGILGSENSPCPRLLWLCRAAVFVNGLALIVMLVPCLTC